MRKNCIVCGARLFNKPLYVCKNMPEGMLYADEIIHEIQQKCSNEVKMENYHNKL